MWAPLNVCLSPDTRKRGLARPSMQWKLLLRLDIPNSAYTTDNLAQVIMQETDMIFVPKFFSK
jgi:hypothetical protein